MSFNGPIQSNKAGYITAKELKGSQCNNKQEESQSSTISDNFEDLVSLVVKELEDKAITVIDVIKIIEKIIKNAGSKYEDVESIEELFFHLRKDSLLPFHTPVVMEVLVNNLAVNSCAAYENYMVNLKQLLEKMLFELPAKLTDQNNREYNSVKKLVLKIDKKWDNLRFKDVLQTSQHIADLLGIPEGALEIECIKEGCVQIDCLIQRDIAKEVTKVILTPEQEKVMRDEHVLKVVCDDEIVYGSGNIVSQDDVCSMLDKILGLSDSF